MSSSFEEDMTIKSCLLVRKIEDFRFAGEKGFRNSYLRLALRRYTLAMPLPAFKQLTSRGVWRPT